MILNNQELNDLFNQCENVKSEKFVVNKKEDDDFGVFECNEESSFDEFGEFKRQGAPIKSNNIDQGVDLNQDSWITMSDLSFLESLSSRLSIISTTTPTNNNYRIDSFITQINRDSTDLITNLETLKSNSIIENPSTSITKKSTLSISSDFGNMVSAIPSGNLNQENFLNFDDQVLPKSSSSNNYTTSSSTKLCDHPEKVLYNTKKNSSSKLSFSVFGEKISAIMLIYLVQANPMNKNNKIMIIGFQFTSDPKMPSKVQLQNGSDIFLRLISQQVDKGNTFNN
ncbi:4837_t:CDS:2 [Funneliformis caledonium]|uniref:4837_t:CDS:1 n=1 Tax=Funneliformis caledonium TaxID=1117310 RepID=A0A9N9BBR2_9GLOM|nr:4837_t:CDS:2 [Funneliformis caledonium]